MEKSTQHWIEMALEKVQTYTQYRELVAQLAASGGTTGPEQKEALVNYTQLNDRRMKRWDKTLRFDEETVATVKAFDQKVTWLVITESWCGDASPSMPVMNKMAELNPNIALKVVLRDEHPELMDRFLTNGARSIPKLVVLDETQQVLAEWGPRSTAATQLVAEYKALHGLLTPEFKQELQQWYNKDKGQSVVQDLTGLLLK